MARPRRSEPGHPDDLEQIRAVPLLRVLHTYGLLEDMITCKGVAVGASPFSDVGILRADLQRNLWDDTGGRPIVSGVVVSDDVVGLVQAIEDMPVGLALDLVRERFIRESRAGTAVVLRRASGPKPSPNPPARQASGDLVFDVPFLRRVGIRPEVAEAWGVGARARGRGRGRIVFPIRRPDGTVVGHAELEPTATELQWRFPRNFRPELGLFGIHRVHLDERVKQAAWEHGLTLVDDPLEVVRMAQLGTLAVVSSMAPSLSDVQLAMIVNPAINPTGRLTAAGEGRRGWEMAVRRYRWRRRAACAQPG